MKLFKKHYFILICIVILSLSILITCQNQLNIQNDDKCPSNLDYLENLRSSPSKGLNHDDYAEIHGYADQYVTWNFVTNPSQIINVWALDAYQYSLWISGMSVSGYLLSTSSSDSGTFNVPSGETWYIVFWNDEIGSQYTIVTYNANFVGDSRPPSINVNSPYSGASYRAGTNCEIKWSRVNAGSSVKIELFKGGSLDRTIIASTSNDGLYNWAIPEDITPGTDYQIKVSSLSTVASDFSVNFEIRDPGIFTIFYPNSTSIVSMGNRYDIQFDNSEYVEEVNISLYHNDEFVYYIETERNNWGYYYQGVCPWNIPTWLTPSPNYSIFICDSEDANANGISEHFEIVEQREIFIEDPSSSTQIQPNSDFTIRWSSIGSIDFVKIILWRGYHYEDNILVSTQLILTISYSTENDGSYIWHVPSLPTGDEYYLKIASTTDSGCWAYTDDFYIGPLDPLSQGIPGYDTLIILSSILLISTVISILIRKKTNLKL